MAKRQGIARRTMSLPAELDRRMEKQSDVNWSEVARAAFEAKLREVEPRPKEKQMADSELATLAADRFKQNRESLAQSQALRDDDRRRGEEYGREAGKLWASKTATEEELRRLESAYGNVSFQSSQELSDILFPNAGVAQGLMMFEVWRTLGEELSSKVHYPNFVSGFAAGATQIWMRTKEQL